MLCWAARKSSKFWEQRVVVDVMEKGGLRRNVRKTMDRDFRGVFAWFRRLQDKPKLSTLTVGVELSMLWLERAMLCSYRFLRRILHFGFSSILDAIAALVRGSEKRDGSRHCVKLVLYEVSCTSSIRRRPKIRNPHRASLVFSFRRYCKGRGLGEVRNCLFSLVKVLVVATWPLPSSCISARGGITELGPLKKCCHVWLFAKVCVRFGYGLLVDIRQYLGERFRCRSLMQQYLGERTPVRSGPSPESVGSSGNGVWDSGANR